MINNSRVLILIHNSEFIILTPNSKHFKFTLLNLESFFSTLGLRLGEVFCHTLYNHRTDVGHRKLTIFPNKRGYSAVLKTP